MDEEQLKYLIQQNESETIEFKKDNASPEKIGKYISALANSAAMLGKPEAYLIWGVDDDTKEIVGTQFKPKEKKKGGEPFITWLERNIDPRLVIKFEEMKLNEKWVVILIIHMTVSRPVSFQTQRYIRSGSSIKNLSDYPEKERALWKSFNSVSFEKEFAKTDCNIDDVFDLLEIQKYLEMLNYSPLSTPEEIISFMIEDYIIDKIGEVYNITNLGAYCFAKDLRNFEHLKSHTVRVIKYKGVNKLVSLSDYTGVKGIVVGFEGLLKYIRTLLPLIEEEYEENGRRIQKVDYPALVLRELVANQIVHQDFSVSGSNPMVEIYDNRLEITNPGAPINEPNRLLDMPPISRNERLADLFKKMHLVESRGSGIDKVVITLEEDNLPAPDIYSKENYMVVVLHKRKAFVDMDDMERNNALYYHSVRLLLEDSFMTNKTVRKRFGLSDKKSSLASNAISQAVKKNFIKPYDDTVGNKFMQYVPFWAFTNNE